jgi:hypothetical protein
MENNEFLPPWYEIKYPEKTIGSELTKWALFSVLVMLTFGLVLMFDTSHNTTKGKE